MKVELTARDIELIISLLAQAASDDDLFFKSNQLFSSEEIFLLEKLESALRQYGAKEIDILDTGSSGFCH